MKFREASFFHSTSPSPIPFFLFFSLCFAFLSSLVHILAQKKEEENKENHERQRTTNDKEQKKIYFLVSFLLKKPFFLL